MNHSFKKVSYLMCVCAHTPEAKMGSFPFLLSTFFFLYLLSWDLILNLELAVEDRLAGQ